MASSSGLPSGCADGRVLDQFRLTGDDTTEAGVINEAMSRCATADPGTRLSGDMIKERIRQGKMKLSAG
jgi:hypothetical protein